MKRYLVIENEVVVNDITCDDTYPVESNMVEVPLYPTSDQPHAGIGWTYVNGEFIEPPVILTAAQNKAIALQALQDSDWTSIADIADPALSNPYLANQPEWLAYRSKMRYIATYPVDGNMDFPETPIEDWKTT